MQVRPEAQCVEMAPLSISIDYVLWDKQLHALLYLSKLVAVELEFLLTDGTSAVQSI
jgi:hypothetical protein